MPFVESQFHWRSSSISYRSFGEGQRLMIAFHGYDQNKAVFDVFESSLSGEFRVVSVDLPYQGNTIWNEEALSAELLQELIHDFLLHLKHLGKVTLLAYSLGGNYALGIAVNTPELVDEMWLIAVDGLKDKPAFRFLTKTFLGHALFLLFVKSARLVKIAIYVSKSLRILPAHVADYYFESVSTQPKRQSLYNRWMSSSRIAPKQKEIYHTIKKHQLTVKMIFGLNDNVIPIKNAYNLKKHVPEVHLKVLNQGHNLLKSKNNSAIMELIKIP